MNSLSEPGFDTQSRNYDSNGYPHNFEFSQDILPLESTTQCFIDQVCYLKYKLSRDIITYLFSIPTTGIPF